MLLSIIIPAYNAERFIGILLKNLIEQIETELSAKDECEIIVVNDGSNDNTENIVKTYEKQFAYVKLINQENKGESGARNTGIENAKGGYIYFLDSDDSLKMGSLNHFTKVIQKEPDLDLYCFAYTSSKNGIQSKDYKNARIDEKKFNRIEFLKEYLAKYLPIHICSCVVKKQLIEQCLLRFSVGLKIGEDIEWLLNVGSVVNSVYFSNRICYIYQIRNDSIMQGYKTYSKAQYHSFEIRRDIILSEKYQTNELKKYSNFWIQNQLLSNIVYYLRSRFVDKTITEALVQDCDLLRYKSQNGALKNTIAIKIAKLLPLKLMLRILK